MQMPRKTIFLILVIGLVTISFQNCSDVDFESAGQSSGIQQSTEIGELPGEPKTPPGIRTDDPTTNTAVIEVIDIVKEADPDVAVDDIYYVHTGLVGGLVDHLVHRELKANPEQCRLNWSTHLVLLDIGHSRNLDVKYCGGFKRAQAVKAKSGACQARVSEVATNDFIHIAQLISVERTYEIDENCVCFKRFKVEIIRDIVQHEVRAFVPQAECAQYFSEYGN